VSVAGIGCGGPSRLGQTGGASERESIRVVERALELGITYIDTARAYGTEAIVGKALAGKRAQVVLSTKVHPFSEEYGEIDADRLRALCCESLERLGCDAIDVFHLHGVREQQYERCLAELVPELEQLRDDGLIRFLALSEAFGVEPGHRVLERAVRDGCWDVLMVGFNPLNQTAREHVFPGAIENGIGIEIMFAVRRALANREALSRVAHELWAAGRLPPEINLDDPLGFLIDEGGAESLVDAAYRFSRHEPGTHVVLTGTGNVAHLEENVRSLNRGPLAPSAIERVVRLFGHLDDLTGN
jgi:aryl-alcohol dehydrogenase-like predicted oxidoreductase